MVLAERSPSLVHYLVKNPPWISQAPSPFSLRRHKASVCSVNRCVAGGHIAHQSAVQKIPQCVFPFFPSFSTVMLDYTLSTGNSFNLSLLQARCALQNRRISAVSTTQASVTRVHRDGLEQRKELFLAFFPRKKTHTHKKHSETTKQLKTQCVMAERFSLSVPSFVRCLCSVSE